jgi:hypothetical protein
VTPEEIEPAAACPSTFWLGLLAFAAVSALTFRGAEFSDLMAFLVLAATALLPAALWCGRRGRGLPIFPLFTLGTIATFALPLIAHHPLVNVYTPCERCTAALTVAATNLAGTVPWYLITRGPRRSSPGPCLVLRRGAAKLAFPAILLVTIVFNLTQGGLMDDLDPSAFSILRAAIIALSNLAVFVLAWRWGRGVSRNDRALCGMLVAGVMISTLPSALMVGALAYGVMALIGYALGRGRVPWLSLAGLGAAALFLQGGKEDLRDKYWHSADAAPISLSDCPGLLADWIRFSCAHLTDREETGPAPGEAGSQSLVERASLLQLFLRIQQMSPDPVPYLHGRTYAIIPGLLVPRALNEQKARTHLGTYMLAIHYDLQTTEDTLTTTIGFGLVNEAMANFGYAGCVALGIGLGIFYGAAARWSDGYPLLSLRSLLVILVLSVAFQNEFSAGVYVTTLFQGACVVLALAPLAMTRTGRRPERVHPALAGAPA